MITYPCWIKVISYYPILKRGPTLATNAPRTPEQRNGVGGGENDEGIPQKQLRGNGSITKNIIFIITVYINSYDNLF